MKKKMSPKYISLYKSIVLGCVCIIVVYVYLENVHLTNWRFNGITELARNLSSISSDRWIVVTTISSPTSDIRFLSQIPGWKVVVVGDTKTPRGWQLSNCVFLSIENQRNLGFETVSHLPERSYARKAVGYLFAIAHGAKVIYETDDDNRPLYSLKRFVLTSTMWGLLYNGKHLFNPYRHFGQPTLWPRGYPLASVGEEATMNYTLGHWKTPSIQQGVVNGDPDMDAIFRLTRKKTVSVLNVTFDIHSPPAIVPEGVFSPFNSQNTLFLYDALWALLIPTTTTFRVCDIWRGYWAQRLLWEMGGTLGFFPPNAFQTRNSHSYLLDAIDEKDLYFQTERLVKFLTEWNCKPERTFFDCLVKLSTDMASQGFWAQGDATLAKAWIRDLKDIGYVEPKRIPFGTLIHGAVSIPDKPVPDQTRNFSMVNNVQFWPWEQAPPLKHQEVVFPRHIAAHLNNIAIYCDDPHTQNLKLDSRISKIPTFPHILLIVVFNFPHYNNLHFLETLYGLHFPHIVYCGQNKTEFDKYARHLRPITFIEVNVGNGWFSQNCLTQAMKMNYNVDGYLYLGDDTLLNVWNIHRLPIDNIWTMPPDVLRHGRHIDWIWYNMPAVGLQTYLKALNSSRELDKERFDRFFKTLAKNTGQNNAMLKSPSDIAYVPRRLKDDVVYFLEHLSRYNLFVEIAIPTVFGGIEIYTEITMIPGLYLWYDGKRKHFEQFFNKEHIFLHPVKISKELFIPKGRTFYCETFLPLTMTLPYS